MELLKKIEDIVDESPTTFLGIQIEKTREFGLKLKQANYLKEFLKRCLEQNVCEASKNSNFKHSRHVIYN